MDKTYSIQGGRTSMNSQGSGINEDVSFTLNNVDNHAVCYKVNTLGSAGGGNKGAVETDTAGSLTSQHALSPMQGQESIIIKEGEAVCFEPGSPDGHARVAKGGVSPTLNTMGEGQREPAIAKGMQVRRLTPIECERLQGFPDNFTKIPYRNKDADNCPDGPRYKALGNSMACNVMHYLGQRIEKVHNKYNEKVLD